MQKETDHQLITIFYHINLDPEPYASNYYINPDTLIRIFLFLA